MSTTGTHWRFPPVFWIANVIELFERAAYYGSLIALVIFLTDVSGYGDVAAGYIAAGFSALVWFLPFVTGALADRTGFRSALALAFALLTVGYAGLGLWPGRIAVLFWLTLVAVGASFVKPIITGTVAKCSNQATRARAYSLFYMLVNVGSFSGKTVARPVRTWLGVQYIPLYSAGAALLALLFVLFLYHPDQATGGAGEGAPAGTSGTRPGGASSPGGSPSPGFSLGGLFEVFKSPRFIALILITSGFWAIQGQLYASMPKYVLRTVGAQASPEWYANVNPLVVMLGVVPITQFGRRFQPVTSIGIALGLIPWAAVVMSLSHQVSGPVSFLGQSVHPITLMVLVGIGLMGLAECFLSPRYLEYASRQAPPGKEGAYLGYAHLNTFFAWFAGFIAAGYLLDAFCPDPARLAPAERLAHAAALAGKGPMPAAYAHAHYIWYVFSVVGALAFVALLVFQRVTRDSDAR